METGRQPANGTHQSGMLRHNPQACTLRRRPRRSRQMMGVNGIARGSQTKIASALGVSDATISRDFRAILDMLNAGRCNLCGNAVRRASPKPYRLR